MLSDRSIIAQNNENCSSGWKEKDFKITKSLQYLQFVQQGGYIINNSVRFFSSDCFAASPSLRLKLSILYEIISGFARLQLSI